MKSVTERDASHIWHPYTRANDLPPLEITSASGAILYTSDGRQIIDAISSWWTNIHGHCHPHITERVSHQLQTLEHVMFAGFTHHGAVDLAERLIRILPGDFSRIFYSDNGSTAVETALKIALQYWQNRNQKRHKIVALKNGYHGDTFGVMSVSSRGIFTKPFEHLLFEVTHIDLNDESAGVRILSDRDVAAFIFEPLVQGAGGMRMYDAIQLEPILAAAKANGVITIADEVMTGFGRTGELFASSQFKHKPDLICLSKALTSGTVPLAVTACPESIYSQFIELDKTFFHGHSFTANPVGCAAALASLDLLETEACSNQIKRIVKSNELFLSRLKGITKVKNPRVCGTILALEVESSEENSYTNSLRDRLYRSFIDFGVLLRPLGNTIYYMPPYAISENELTSVQDAIMNTLSQI